MTSKISYERHKTPEYPICDNLIDIMIWNWLENSPLIWYVIRHCTLFNHITRKLLIEFTMTHMCTEYVTRRLLLFWDKIRSLVPSWWRHYMVGILLPTIPSISMNFLPWRLGICRFLFCSTVTKEQAGSRFCGRGGLMIKRKKAAWVFDKAMEGGKSLLHIVLFHYRNSC